MYLLSLLMLKWERTSSLVVMSRMVDSRAAASLAMLWSSASKAATLHHIRGLGFRA